jgi:hypothetical protein
VVITQREHGVALFGGIVERFVLRRLPGAELAQVDAQKYVFKYDGNRNYVDLYRRS